MKKNIVLTGVSRGLGRALVTEFVNAGHMVAGCARDQSAIEELKGEHASPHLFSVIDVLDDNAVSEWAQEVMAGFGSPDLLINNAASINVNAPLWEVPVAEFSQVIDVNIKGVFHVMRHFIPGMIKKRQGVIVNLSSGWGRSVSAEVAPYCASKWAIEGLTQALAQELPTGMAAVPLNPGVINTEMLQSCFGEAANGHRSAQEWAKTAAPFLVGLDQHANGQSLTAP